MGADRILMLKLLGDTTSIDKSLRKTEGRLKGMSRAGLQWGKAFAMGLAIEGIEKLGDAIGDAWTGFREGEKAGAQLATTWANLGKDGDELAGVIDDISRMTLRLGTDDTEAINAYNQALKTTGGDGKAAMDRLRIAQNLVANGSAPSLSSALGIIQQAAKGSARTVDRFGLTADTAGGRVKELGRKVRGAAKAAADADPLRVFFNRINEDLEGIVGSLSKGDLEGTLASMRDIGKALNDAWDKVGPAVTGVVDKLTGGAFSEFMKKVDETFKPILEKFVAVIDDMAYAWSQLQPVLADVLTWIQPVIDLVASGVEGSLGFVLDAVSGTIRALADLLKGKFSAAWETAGDTIARLKADIETIVNGIAEFLNKALGGIGETAGKIGSAIFDGIVGGVQRMARAVINVWNSLGKFPAGGFTFAEAFDIEIMGQHIGWPKIAISWGAGDIIPNIGGSAWGGKKGPAKLADGGIVKKRPGGMLAVIGEGRHDEAVIPLDGRQGMSGTTVNVYVNVAPTANLAEVGREITRALKAYGQGGGMPSMKSAIGVG